MKPTAQTLSCPSTHYTRHEDGQFSLMHHGQPLTRPQTLAECQFTARRYKLPVELPTWDAETLSFGA